MSGGDRGGSHPSPAELDRFLLGKMSPHQAASVVAHLLRDCELCRQRMSPLASAVFAAGPVVPPSTEDPHPEYDFPLFKAFAAARQYAEARAQSKAYAQRYPERQFPREVPAIEALLPPAVGRDSERCEALLEQCRALRHSDPEGMMLAASMAVILAERMNANESPETLADLQAQTWAELGNAYRAADDLANAEAALARAVDLAGHGTGDPLLLARLMDLTASLYTEQRRFGEAHRLLDWIYAIYRHLGDGHLAARALISKGISVVLAAESEEALNLLQQGILLADATRDPKLILSAVHALLVSLVDCDRLTEARALLEASRDLYTAQGERFDLLRARWLEGRIAGGLGQDREAERAFLQVRESFRKAELLYTTANVSLDLAAVWLRQGRIAEIKGLVDETVAIFRAHNIQREAIAVLLMLRDALRKDRATVVLLKTVASELQRLEQLPRPKAV